MTGLAAAAVAAACYLIGFSQHVEYQRRCAICKQNLHAIQLVLERYGMDQTTESMYPHNLDELKAGGYLQEFPVNPFTGQPMKAVGVAYWPERGDFIYYQRGKDALGQLPADEPVIGYTLEGYF